VFLPSLVSNYYANFYIIFNYFLHLIFWNIKISRIDGNKYIKLKIKKKKKFYDCIIFFLILNKLNII